MKKVMVIAIILSTIFITTKTEAKIIPDEAIRFRVIANSNSEYDQYIKSRVSDSTQQYLFNILKDVNDIEKAKEIIINNKKSIELSVNGILEEEKYDQEFWVSFGSNRFPAKEYKGIVYEEGNYESLVITLGTGMGNNWWCVLFPPLCLLEAEEATDVEYKFFVQEIINKYFKS